MRQAIWLILAASAAFGQAFEVASVKPAARRVQNAPRTPNGPERLTLTNTPLRILIERAYELKSYQVSCPGWLDSEKFDILAKIPPGATKDQFPPMLQNLLRERFNLAFHRDSKEMSVYELEVGKNGSKLRASDLSIPEPEREHLRIGDKNGVPQVPPGLALMVGRITDGIMHWTGRMQSISQLASFLENELERPVVDRTGLTGQYDFTLEYSREGLRPVSPADTLRQVGLSLVGAVQEQLGLKLESKKDTIDILVVDHIEKVPTDN